MTADEYGTYVVQVQAEVVRELGATMSEEEARGHAASGVAHYLPYGIATPHHTLLVAENGSGVPVGQRLGRAGPFRGENSDGAWLYDINEVISPRSCGRDGAGTTFGQAP